MIQLIVLSLQTDLSTSPVEGLDYTGNTTQSDVSVESTKLPTSVLQLVKSIKDSEKPKDEIEPNPSREEGKTIRSAKLRKRVRNFKS